MKTVLVAEDNAVNRELIRELLQSRGYQVIEARDGAEALEKLAARPPDLIILDIQMPALDGFAALQAIRRDPRFPAIPVVALTAYAMQGDKEKVLSAGFDAYITKPIHIAGLLAEIERLLNHGRRPG